MYDPLQEGADHPFEWIELYNSSSHVILLSNWKISDNYRSNSIPEFSLSPGEFIVIAAGDGFYENYPSFKNRLIVLDEGKIGNGLNNNGDRLLLLDGEDRIIDALCYGDDTSIMIPPCRDVDAGHSLERFPAGFDTNHSTDFIDNADPSPGYSPQMNTTPPTDIPEPSIATMPVGNEVIVSPDSTPTPAPMISPPALHTTTPTGFPVPQSPLPAVSQNTDNSNTRTYLIFAVLLLLAGMVSLYARYRSNRNNE